MLGTALPLLAILSITLWRAPYPISDCVGIFEDIARRNASSFLLPTSSYYRPLYFLTLSAIWHGAGSVGAALALIRFLHIVPLAALVLLFIRYLRPASVLDAGAATLGVAVLAGAPGLLGNLELPLSYTIIGMPVALMVWMLLEREGGAWQGVAIVALTVVAIGFKEQGLVVVPIVVAAWWMGAPGARRWTALTVTAIAVAYVGFRLRYHDPSLPMFEQEIGFGFGSLSPPEAEERFGRSPLLIYAYSAAATIGNVLLAEPTDGQFRFARALNEGRTYPWHAVYFGSSAVLTAIIAWWGARTIAGQRAAGRTLSACSPDCRLFVATLLAVFAAGVLSFNYSRDRLGGMAAVFYALAAVPAVRAAALRASKASRPFAAAVTITLVVLACAWQLRAIYTVEFTRQRAVNSQREWITKLRQREADFADRPVYLRIMRDMVPQGTSATPTQPTTYPRWLTRLLGEY